MFFMAANIFCILAFGYVLSQAQIVVMVMVMVLNVLCDEELKAISVKCCSLLLCRWKISKCILVTKQVT